MFVSYFHASYFEIILKLHVGYIIFHGLTTNNQDMASEAEWSVVKYIQLRYLYTVFYVSNP